MWLDVWVCAALLDVVWVCACVCLMLAKACSTAHTHITQWQPAYTQESIQVKHVVGVSNSSTARTLVRLKKSNFFLKKNLGCSLVGRPRQALWVLKKKISLEKFASGLAVRPMAASPVSRPVPASPVSSVHVKQEAEFYACIELRFPALHRIEVSCIELRYIP